MRRTAQDISTNPIAVIQFAHHRADNRKQGHAHSGVGRSQRIWRLIRSEAVTEQIVRIMCPNLGCRKVLSVPISARGKVVRCSGCQKNLRVPQAGEAKAPAPGAKPGESGGTPPPGKDGKGKQAA